MVRTSRKMRRSSSSDVTHRGYAVAFSRPPCSACLGDRQAALGVGRRWPLDGAGYGAEEGGVTEVEDAAVPAEHVVAGTSGCGAHGGHRLVEPDAAGRAEEARVAEGEDAA